MKSTKTMNKKILKRKMANKRRQSKSWDIIHEDGREVIQQWKDKRVRLRGARKSYREMLVYSFNLDMLKSFLQNINFMVVLQIIIAVISVYIFQKFDVFCFIPINLFVAPIVFPLAFSINTDFQRRERVLEELAAFKSSGMIWYFCMREWQEAAGLDEDWIYAAHAKLKSLIFHLHEYLLTYKPDRRKLILSVMYEDFSDASQLIEKLRASKLPANPAIVSKAVTLVHAMCSSFERLRVVREYRSPRSIRSFNKVFIALLPIILAPYFVSLQKEEKGTSWQPYYIAVVVAFVFTCLQGVQDKLDDPFDGMSEDDVNLDVIDEWVNGSLVPIMGRVLRIGGHKTAFVEENDTDTIYSNSFGHSTDICSEILSQGRLNTPKMSPNPAKRRESVNSKGEPLVHQLVSSVLSRMKSSPRLPKHSLDSQLMRFKDDNFVRHDGNDISKAIFKATSSLDVNNIQYGVKKKREAVVLTNENVVHPEKKVSFVDNSQDGDTDTNMSDISNCPSVVTDDILEHNMDTRRNICDEICAPLKHHSDGQGDALVQGNKEDYVVEIDSSNIPFDHTVDTYTDDINSIEQCNGITPLENGETVNSEDVKLGVFLEDRFENEIGLRNGKEERYDVMEEDCGMRLKNEHIPVSKHLSSRPVTNGWTTLSLSMST